MPYDADQVANLDAELDALDSPTTVEVLAHSQDYDAGIVAASAARRALGAGGGSQPITSPLDIDDCVLWLDASTLALADDDPVATWPDGSASNFDAAQAVAANQPVFKTAVLNGLGVVRFSQAGAPDLQYLALSGAGLGLFRAVDGFTIAAVAANPVAQDAYSVISASVGGDNTLRRAGLDYHGDGPLSVASANDDSHNDRNTCDTTVGVNAGLNPPAAFVGAVNLLTAATTCEASVVNGVPNRTFRDTPGPTPDTASDAILIGAVQDLSAGSDFDIGEIIVYNRALNARERRELLDYLSAKWATL